MKAETKKYLRKRTQIINIITEIEAVYESDDIYITTNPDFWKARDAAEKILAKVGISKPKEVEEQESSVYAIG
jgi:hypothetical protein